ncbi:MAG: DUF1016 N-terminal domain-containing protein [Bacteroidota bacterium]
MAYKFGDGPMDSIKHTVNNGYTGLLSTINSGVNLLFWEIGAIISKSIERSDLVGNDFAEEFSSNLSPIFGDYLGSKNLSLMKLFAEKCSTSTIGQISDAMDWEYIPYLLDLEGEKAWLYYIQLIQTARLDPIALKNKILAKAIENKIIGDEVLDRTELKSLYRGSCQFYFEKNDGKLFRRLFEPRALDDKEIITFLSKQSANEPVMKIYELILEFQSETHYVLNMQFNMLMYTIGGHIIRLSNNLNISITELIDKCIQEFGNYFPSLFNKEELSYCIKLGEQYKISTAIMEMAERVAWPHIKLLLEVNDLEKRHAIARQIFNNGINVQQLKRMIANNSFDLQNISSGSTTPIKRSSVTTETRDGSNINLITEYLVIPIIHPVYDLNRNIYKTPELLSFLTNNTY